MAEGKNVSSQGPGVVTLVEGSALRSAAGRARLVFLSVTASLAVLGAVVLTPWLGPAWGLLLGGVAGFGLGLLLGVMVWVWPVLRVLWHWSAEISTVLVLVAGSTWLSSETAPIVPSVLLVVLLAAAIAVRPVRRWVRALVWCAIVRHRLRLSFAAFLRSRNRIHVHGTHPLILLARPTPAGERVWVWLRPGLDLAALEENTSKLAVACWAASVRVMGASARYAALVRVDVTRRDPLTDLVRAPLMSLIPGGLSGPGSAGEAPTGGLDLDEVPEEAVAPVLPMQRQRGGA
jgi:hypothetical protein